jgi:sec-independent protein translocase protein TatA
MFGLSMQELVLIGILAVLLFGKKLPEVAKTVGKTYNQFRKGLNDMQGDFHRAMHTPDEPVRKTRKPDRYDEYDDRDEASAPKFEPPPAAPREVDRPA